MLDLVKFEFKKLLARRTSQMVSAGIMALLCVIMALNVVQTKTSSSTGEILGGTAAIAQQKARAEAHEGVLTVERVQEEVAAYRALAFSKVDPAQVEGLSAEAAYAVMKEAYDEDEFRAIYDTYYSYLLSPWIAGSMEQYQVAAQLGDEDVAGFYGAVADSLQRALDDGMGGTWAYSDAERAYWTEKQAAVGEPLSYGYAGGWGDVLACLGFLSFAMVAVCVVLTPVFAGEYQDRTDAVLLAARYGRSKLVAAKIVASLLFATAYYALATAVIVGVTLAFFGAEGGDLPVQVLALGIPYDLTMAEAAWTAIGLGYLMTLGLAALTLLLSSKLRSQLAIFAVCAALVFLPGMIPSGGSGAILHALYLFPINALNDQVLYNSLVSYPLGPLVIDLVGLLAILYAVVLAVCAPLAARAFRRHQVM
ncbi:ABC transporter permease subunit [Gordonibacter urolithinfaciens]|jgi:ABC-type transport system involved in multi-copper enzyme maturation permease subunit|uniref:ABC transporter permease subunit n=1 Tax=Gordonibacter urolithinfaciens TaxID=1335613 RepID=A0A7K0IDI0_9ACTN|nr:ABC transporter permease subunit [Gordonibacter urolithinfaciens]MBS6975483.1 ABC transporter permease subunit [Eggerthellaceae bacterium]MCB6562056.1 ABC transporter permease subunit [Gordonibacter urolithinfaciens]MCB7086432.1 ABC transporter permease subunit [Gordonibacter urolithinfaciens]MSA95598.1 ABC transporter permease subunit [Gordonibacter urolithinfaciens]